MKRPLIPLIPLMTSILLTVCTCGSLLRADQPQSAGQASVGSTWCIGIYTGPSPFQLSVPPNVSNPVLTPADVTDLSATVVAHPFMIVTDSKYYMFLTVKDKIHKEGGIGLAESNDGLDWKYRQIVIDEPFDLSYPCVFQWQDEYYMMPEAHTETSVRLYKATDFPLGWTYEKDLLTGDHFISPSIVRHKDMWWIFVVRPGNETLRLFYATDLAGPWTEHPQSPIVEKDLRTARPGGRPIVIDGILYRMGQYRYPKYCVAVRAFQVTDISTTVYKEQVVDIPIVQAASTGWNARSMHHVDLHQIRKSSWIAAVDGHGRSGRVPVGVEKPPSLGRR